MKSYFLKILSSDKPGALLRNVAGAGILPFLNHAAGISAGPVPWHTGSVLDHMVDCMDAVSGDSLAVWMAMAHDSGKLTTPSSMLPHHYGHELRGAKIAALWANILEMPAFFRICGSMCSLLHMKAGNYCILRPGTRYRLIQEVNELGCFDSFWKVVDADTSSKVSEKAKRDLHSIKNFENEAEFTSERLRQEHIRLIKNNSLTDKE